MDLNKMDLRELRIQKGLSQIEMARLLDMTEQNYRNYERRAYKEMAPEIEKRISDILETEYTYAE